MASRIKSFVESMLLVMQFLAEENYKCVCVLAWDGWVEKQNRKELRLGLELNFSSFPLKLCKYVQVKYIYILHIYMKYITNTFLRRRLLGR